MTAKVYCNDYGDPDALGCLGEADPKYVFDFTDVEPGCFIHWCAHCGPEAHAMKNALDDAFKQHGEPFLKELEANIVEQEGKQVKQ